MRRLGGDTVLISLNPSSPAGIPAKEAWPDGTEVTDLYSGKTSTVANGSIHLPDADSNVAVIVRKQ